MTSPEPAPGRGTALRLRLFAAAAVLAGCGLLALAALQLAVGLGGHAAGAPPMEPRAVWTGAGTLVALAAVLVHAGQGAWRYRRWAPALLRAIGWTWLLFGLFSAVVVWRTIDDLLLLAQRDGVRLDPTMAVVAGWVVLAIVVGGGVVFPALLLVGVHGRGVERLCRARDRRPAWTDGRPDAVLGFALAFVAAAGLMLPVVFGGALPVFHRVLRGPAATLAGLALAAAFLLAAWRLYRLRSDGWWLAAALILGLGVSATATFFAIPLPELLERLDYPEEQRAMLAGLPRSWLLGCTLAVTAIGLGQLFWIRRYLRGAATAR